MDDLLAVMFLVITALVGAAAGSSFNDHGWRRDCEALGKTVSDGHVWECKKIERK